MDFNLHDIFTFLQNLVNFTLFRINQTPVTLASIFMFLIVLGIFFILSRLLVRTLVNNVLSRLHIESGLQFTLSRITHYIIIIIGAIVAFQFVGIDLSGLAVIFGLLSVGIGFGLQNITSNFVAGLILLFERPIRIGDRVTVGDTEGDVLAINMRATTILSLDNISIIVPNSEFISSNVINWSHGDPKVRLVVDVGVSYNSDLDTVEKALYEVAETNPDILRSPAPEVIFDSFGDSAWNMKLRVWLADPQKYYQIRSNINSAIVRKFREYEVEIPFPQQDLHVRSPLPVPLASENLRGKN